MKEVFIILAGMSVCGGAAYLWYLLTVNTFGRRLSAAGRFDFLKAAVLLFVLPVSKLLSPLLSITERLALPTSSVPSAPPQTVYPDFAPPLAVPVIPSAPQMGAAAPDAANNTAARISIDILAVLVVIWLVGVAACLIWRLICRLRFERDIKGMLIPASGEIMSVYRRCREDMGITRSIPVYICEKVYTPMIVGAIRPKIILPQREISEKSLEFVFRHELTHYQRGDIFAKMFVSLVTALHWFNPIVHAFGRELILWLELSCDERVGRILDIDGRKEYCMAILEAVPIKRNAGIGLVFGTSGKEELKKRLENMMNFKKMRLSHKIIAAVVAVVIITVSCVLVAMFIPADRAKNDDLPADNVSNDDGVDDSVNDGVNDGVKDDTDGPDIKEDDTDTDEKDVTSFPKPEEVFGMREANVIFEIVKQWMNSGEYSDIDGIGIGRYEPWVLIDTANEEVLSAIRDRISEMGYDADMLVDREFNYIVGVDWDMYVDYIDYTLLMYEQDELTMQLMMTSGLHESRVEYFLNVWKSAGEYDIRKIITSEDDESGLVEIRLILGNKEDGEKILQSFREMGYAPRLTVDMKLYDMLRTLYRMMQDKKYEINGVGVRPTEGNVYIFIPNEEDIEAVRQRLISMGYDESSFKVEKDTSGKINTLPR